MIDTSFATHYRERFQSVAQQLQNDGWHVQMPGGAGYSITAVLNTLKTLGRTGRLPERGPADYYATVQHLRVLADYFERDLIRMLRQDGLTWEQIADKVDAQLGSRQAAQQKWARLIAPGRRTTTGDTRRGGRPRHAATK